MRKEIATSTDPWQVGLVCGCVVVELKTPERYKMTYRWPENVWWNPSRPTFTMQGYCLISDQELECIGQDTALDPEGNVGKVSQLLQHATACKAEANRYLFAMTYRGLTNEHCNALRRHSHYFDYLARRAMEEVKARTRGYNLEPNP
jgi:hypothetical protein